MVTGNEYKSPFARTDARDWLRLRGKTVHLWDAPDPHIILREDYAPASRYSGMVEFYPYLTNEEEAWQLTA